MDNQLTTISLQNIKAVIFDMDGTMVNNMVMHKKAWKEYFAKKGITLTDEDFKIKISGANNAKIFENVLGKVFPREEVDSMGQEKEALYRKLYAPEVQEVAGLISVIHTLKSKELKLGIATTAIKENREFILQALGIPLDTFDAIVGDEHVTNGKPHPEIYHMTAQKLGVKPEECLVFEDSPPGVASAKAAGMTVVGLLTTHTKEELHEADFATTDFAHISFSKDILSRDEDIISELVKNKTVTEVGDSLDDNKLVDSLTAEIEKKYMGSPVIVTLTGGPGGGKSTLKNALIKRLEKDGHPSDFVSTDDFGLYSREERNRLIKEGEINPWTAKDWNLLNEIVAEVRKGNKVKAPVYNEQTGDAVVVGKGNFPHLIPDGLHVFFIEGDFQPVNSPDLKIYFHVPTDVRRENRIRRDMEKRNGGDREKIIESFDYRLESQYYPYTLPNAQKADILIVTKVIYPDKGGRVCYSYSVFLKHE